MPQISIIVPTFNRLAMLKRALASIERQTYRDLEIVVIDNGSSDGTWDYLGRYASEHKGVVVARFSENTGSPMACYNKGLEIAQGRFIGIMYDDDELIDDALQFLYQKAIENGHPWVTGNCIDSETKEFTFYGLSRDSTIDFDTVAMGRVSGEAWSLFSRDLIGDIRFDSNMYGGESSVWLQMYKKTNALYFHRPVRVYYRQHGDNLTGLARILANVDKLIYTELRYLDLFQDDFDRLGILKGKYYRIALMKMLGGDRLGSVYMVPNYLSLAHLPKLVFHLMLLPMPTRALFAGAVARRRIIDWWEDLTRPKSTTLNAI